MVYCSVCHTDTKVMSSELSFSELGGDQESCAEHLSEYTMFCFTCDSAICDTCTSEEHVSHEYLTVHEASAVKASELRSRAHDLTITLRNSQATKRKLLQAKEDLFARAEEVTYQIYTTFGKYIRAVQEREQALLAQVDNIQRAKEKVLDLQIEDISRDAKTAEETCSFTKKLIAQGSQLDIINAHSTVLSRIDNLEFVRRPSVSCESDDVRFISEDGEVFLEATTQLGRVEGHRRTFPQKSRIAEELPRSVVCGVEQSWTVLACDVLGSCVGAGGELVGCLVESGNEQCHCQIVDYEDGRYGLVFTPHQPGSLTVTVRINGHHIHGSPFLLNCLVRRDYALVGECLLFGGGKGSKLGQLLHPTSIALNKSETKLYISDSDNHRVQIWSYPELQCLTSFGCQGNGPGQFYYPYGLCVAGDRLYVADCKNHRIQVFTEEGFPVGIMGEQGVCEGQLSHPYDVKVDQESRVFVTDSANFRVQVFSPQGHFLFLFGGKGSKPGQMLCPWGLYITDSTVIIADFKSNNIQTFTKEGEFISRIKSSKEQAVALSNPAGLTSDREGNILVCDRSNHSVQIFDSAGQFVSRFGGKGSHLGGMKYPTSVVTDSSGNIIVCDAFNHRVQIF